MVKSKAQRRDKESGLILVDRPEDVPQFATDEEEVAFWDTHAFSERFWKKAKHVPPAEIAHQKPHRAHRGWLKMATCAVAIGLAYGARKAAEALRR